MNPIIAAIDAPTLDDARRTLDRIADAVSNVKIGKELFTAAGPAAVELARSRDKRVFLDLKYHDIPNTVAGAVRAAAALGVWMLNIHIAGGRVMLEAARDALDGLDNKPILIGVTVLTSLDDGLWSETHGPDAPPVSALARRMSKLAQKAGMDGVVASPLEIRAIRDACGEGFVIVTPGVRPRDAAANDQRRTMTPGEAIAAGSDYLVVGRPITQADDPAEAARSILDDIAANS